MPTITVIIPAYNEEANLEAAYLSAAEIVRGQFENWEILIINDCSSDKTGDIAEALSARDPHVRVIHNPENRGFGWNYGEGVRQAKMDFVLMIPGDNEIDDQSIKRMLSQTGKADILVPYPQNRCIRPPMRRIVSRLFVSLINSIFSLNLRYFNGPVVHKRDIIQKFPLKTGGFAYQAEALVNLIKAGHTYLEVPFRLKPRMGGDSKAFRAKNVVSVIASIFQTMWDVKVAGQ